jgi:phosphoglycerate dehydrogenase-like enzyme
MRVLACRRKKVEPPDFVDRMAGPDDILKGSDVIFVTVPLSDRTKAMVGKAEFAKMKDGVFLLSSSRPDVIDEAALIGAMRGKKVKGAVVDTMWSETVRGMEGVRTFQHATPEHYNIWPRMFELFAENLRRFTGGKGLLNRIKG